MLEACQADGPVLMSVTHTGQILAEKFEFLQ